MHIFTTFSSVNASLSCFKQLWNSFDSYLWPKQLNAGARLVIDVIEVLKISSDNLLDFHSEVFSVFSIFLKYLCIGWNTK